MSTLTIFKETFTNRLRSEINANLEKYKEDVSWITSIGTAATRELPTGVPPNGALELVLPDGDDLKDVDNAIRVHKALSRLTPLQARDPRLWTRLAHVELWAYMRKRWPVESYESDASKAARFVESRYFVPQSQSRSLLRNGISRLWWTAALSHDADRENPYELTKILLSSLDITQTLLERNLGRAPQLTKGFLSFLQRNEEELLSGGDVNRLRIRHFAKFLNLYGGVCLLDSLTVSEVIALLEAEFARMPRAADETAVQA